MVMRMTAGHSRSRTHLVPLLLAVFVLAVTRWRGWRSLDGDRGDGGTCGLAVMNGARDVDILGDRHRSR